ncbi:MAG TPA: hypothetical protein VFG87_02450 [Amycolatopsis sp.]|jgi:hypothetical protein|nr:hypothetical protein [Amycolatopsis sp.]
MPRRFAAARAPRAHSLTITLLMWTVAILFVFALAGILRLAGPDVRPRGAPDVVPEDATLRIGHPSDRTPELAIVDGHGLPSGDV